MPLVALGVAVALAVWGGSRDISSEAAVSMHGDMARYLMNGVFLRDLAASGAFLSWNGLIRFGEMYYAQYPALSIGHHPPLLPGVLAVAFELFGVSVTVGRSVSVAAFVVAVCALFALATRLFGWRAGGWTAALFATHPAIVSFGQQVMAEMLMLSLVCLAFWQLFVFLQTVRVRHLAAFVLLAVLSVAARQLAVVAVPGYLAAGLISGRWRRLLRREMLLAALAGVLVLVPLAILTFELSPYNVGYVLNYRNRDLESTIHGGRTVVATHLQPWLWAGVAAAVVAALVHRDRRLLLPLGWGVGGLFMLLVLTGDLGADRYSLALVPAFCLTAGALDVDDRARWFRRVSVLGLAAILAAQMMASAQVRPVGASYEAAARWVVAQPDTPTVMFSGPVDTGYFVFFVRKHDPGRRLVVLRSDKIFTTSLMDKLAREERIGSPADIYPILQRFGTRFVVIEDVPVGPAPLVWFHRELASPRFAERLRIRQQTRDVRLQGSDLVIYEYLDATAPDPAAVIDLSLPLIGRELAVPLADLLDAGATVP